MEKTNHPHLSAEIALERVVLKFKEGTRVRLRGNHLTALGKIDGDKIESDLATVHYLIARHPAAKEIDRLFTQSEEELADRKEKGEKKSGRTLADLDLYYEVEIRRGTTAGEVADLLDALNALESVEIAYAQDPAVPATAGSPKAITGATTVPTPNFQSQQGYLNAAPQGVDALYAWTQAGGAGQGIKIVDVEGNYLASHEDLPTLFHNGGIVNDDGDFRFHGTAALGIVVGKNNGFGVTGIAHQAQAGFSGIGLSSYGTAVLDAATAAGPGGVVLIEIQVWGPPTLSSSCTCNPDQCRRAPMEWHPDVRDAIRTATANGTVVIELAGNGDVSLDDPAFFQRFQDPEWHSGAIMVGGLDPSTSQPMCYSNWGSRVDLHGWSNEVTTLSYGDLFNDGDEARYYTSQFSGTSSASAIVAGATTSLLGRILATTNGWHPSPATVRDLLVATGTPSAPTTRNIGKMPNLRAAFDLLAANPAPVASLTFSCSDLSCTFDGSGSTDDTPLASHAWSFGDAAGATGVTASHAYAAAGSYTATLTVTDKYGAQASASRVVNVTADAASPDQSYFPVAPCRIFDTRSADPVVATGGILSSGTSRMLQMTGRCGIPASASAVAVNAVALFPADRGNFQFFPGDLSGGVTSTASLNFGTSNRANNSVLRLATDGSGTLKVLPYVVNGSQVHTVMDVLGYFSGDETPGSGSAGLLGFQALAPCTVSDSRSGAPLDGGDIVLLPAKGNCGIPANAEAGSFLFRIAQPTVNGSAVLFPTNGAVPPPTSTINFLAGTQLITNSALTPLAPGSPDVGMRYAPAGGVAGTAHVVLDTNGYFAPGAPLGFHPLTPCRVIDTRSASQGAPVLAHGSTRNFQVQGQCGVPPGARAAFVNVIAWTPTAAGGLTAFAGGTAAPALPTVTFPAGEPALGNGVIVPLGLAQGQDLALLASAGPAGTVHAIVDVFGYFTAPSLSADFHFSCSGLTCSFDSSATANNVGPAAYSWSFGDSTSGTSSAPSHTYAASGSYTVTLTLTDSIGQTSTRTRTVAVTSETPLPDQRFFSLPGCRAIDTRSSDPTLAAGGLLTSGTVRNLQITGRCLVPSTATAVAVNIVALPQGNRGSLQLFPGNLSGGLTPTASVNFGLGNRANNAILRLASDGTLKVSPFVANAGSVHMVVDVNGYFSDDAAPVAGATGPLGFQSLAPDCRLFETFSGATLTGGQSVPFLVQGQCSVPADTPVALLNLTIANPTSGGSVLLFPNGPAPATSTINFAAASPNLTNGAIVPLTPLTGSNLQDVAARYGTAGQTVKAYLDVHGYFRADAPLAYHPITPCRAFDSRSASSGGPSLSAGEERLLRIQGNCGVPAGAKAVFANVISWLPQQDGYLSAYAAGSPRPIYRALSFTPSEIALGNGLILPLAASSGADLTLSPQYFSTTGIIDVIVDVFGYFD